jgi:ACR3 family arsenite efflux pump ArsB
MALLGALVGRLLRFPAGDGRALLFSGITRNSLVVLPVALALGPAYAAAPVVVVTQTLVEVVGMVVAVRVVPRLV